MRSLKAYNFDGVKKTWDSGVAAAVHRFFRPPGDARCPKEKEKRKERKKRKKKKEKERKERKKKEKCRREVMAYPEGKMTVGGKRKERKKGKKRGRTGGIVADNGGGGYGRNRRATA